MLIQTNVLRALMLFGLALSVAGCESRTSGSLGFVEPDTPDAQPCGDGCPDGQTCVPSLNADGVAEFICLDEQIAYCAPCSTDDDCFDDRLLNISPTCVNNPDGSGSFCATPCTTSDECPVGAHCELFMDGTSACLPDDGQCSCSDWATERGALTACSISNAEGTCQGERSCDENGLTECSARVPSQEICDGEDNNCDGATDDTFPEFGLDCDGDDLDLCVGGTYFCVEGVLVCNDDDLSIVEECNAQDDDCDGLADEELTAREIVDAQGVCRGSIETCEGALGWVAPDFTLIEAYEEDEATCDGLDNDCDGATDEAFTRDEGYIWSTLDGIEDLFIGDECGAGICSGGVVQCADSGDGLECSTASRALPETCDGLDNDCDGIIDNGLSAPLAAEQRGICAGLTQVCDENGAWIEPDYFSLSGYEAIEVTCDGLDNDCDGEVDEALDAPAAELTLGVCQGATKVCAGESGWVEPNYMDVSSEYQVEEMWCDDLDNDCDGQVDEFFLEGGLISYTDLTGQSGLYKGDACGAGACSGGQVLCNDARTGLTCSTVGLVSAELCNGSDDNCDGIADDGFDFGSDEANCGACGITCSNPHGNTQCAGGVCIPSCDPLWGDCVNPNDGCETSLTTVSNCGGCGVVCELPNAIEFCSENGTCGIAECEPGWADCDGIVANGCESNLGSDLNSCGACGVVCANANGDAACVNGLCVASCDPGWSDCDGNSNNGCETPLNTLSDCGACGVVCGASNADATCETGICTITQCDVGFEDCNGELVDGCEINYLADVNNCNGCGTLCAPSNGAGVCNNGSCDVADCNNLFCDLDGASFNGCELPLDTNPSCSGAVNLGVISGDTSSTPIQVTGQLGEGWFKVRVTEDDGNWFSSADLSLTVSLVESGNSNYELLTRFDSCGGSNTGSSGDNQTIEWDDNRPIGGSDDSRDIYIRVNVANANTCDTWSLSIVGDTN